MKFCHKILETLGYHAVKTRISPGLGPVYLKQVICPVSDLSRRSLRSAGRGDLFVSRANTSIGQRSFSIAAPVVWNALPPDLRSPHISRKQF